MNIKTIIGDYEAFIENIVRKVSAKGVGIHGSSIDHLCYRVATESEYQKVKSGLVVFSSAIATTIHNGREFSIFKLKEPLAVKDYKVPLIELPSPAKDKPYATGLEHIEIVMGADFQNFCEANKNRLLFDKDMQAVNATAHITLEDGATVKFHAIPLDEAVRLQGGSFRPVELNG